MSNYTNSLNELINTKKELKDIIIESTGENPSEVFSYYPSYIRSAIAAGGASEEAVNSYISAYLSAYNFIDQTKLSSNSYITMGDVSACGYITSHQDLSSYATKSYVVDYVATYAPTPDLSSYVTKTELSAQSYITMGDVSACGYITINDVPSTDLSGYVSKTELSAQSYLTQHQDLSSYVSKIELNGMSYATQSYVMDKIGAIPSPDLSSYVTYDYLSNQSYISSIPSEYITQDELSANSYLTQHQSLVSYLSVENLNTAGTKMQLRTNGLTVISTTNSIAPKSITYTDLVNNSSSNNWIGQTTLQNYVNGRLSDIESTYATTSYVADYVATYASGGSGNYLPLTGGEVTGPLYVSYQQTNNALYGFKSYSHIVAGDEEKTTPAFLASKRYCTNGIGSYINMASFFVNSDGRAKFAHKASGGGGGDDSFMCFNAYGFKISYSGEAGVSASTEYDLIHSGNIGDYAGVTNENIIPKETNTYTLGDSSYFYSNSYVSDMWLGTKNKFSNRSDNQVNLMLNNGWKYSFHTNGIFPADNNNRDLGQASNKWKNTYSYNYYFGYNTAISSDSDYGVQLTINGNKNYQWNMYQFTMTNNNYRNQCSLGTNGSPWAYTYTSYLYTLIDGVSTDIGYYLSYNLAGIETLLANI